jgi:hypothetical protein
MSSETQPKSKALPLFIVLFILSLLLSAFLFFRYAKTASVIQEQNEELTLAYQALNLKSDSLQVELDEALAQLQLKINENLAQVDLKEDLRIQLEEKTEALEAAHRRISKLIAQGNGSGGSKKLLEAKSQIADLTEKNNQYISEIEASQKNYANAKAEAERNAERARELLASTDSLNVENSALASKLKTASIIDIAGLNVTAVRTKKGKEENTPKANRAERLKVSFSVLGSEIAENEEKNILIRIVGPSGVVLTTGTEELTNSDDLYSLEENFYFDGTEKKIIYYYDQEEDYKKGLHKVEIYNEKVLLDRSSFSLR